MNSQAASFYANANCYSFVYIVATPGHFFHLKKTVNK